MNFTHALVEDDEASARYDPSSGYLTVSLTKAVVGQTFEDLDLLAKLLAPRPSERAPEDGPLIEVLDSEEAPGNAEDDLIARTQGLSLDRQEILEGMIRYHIPSRFRTDPTDLQPRKMTGKSDKRFLNPWKRSRSSLKCLTDSCPYTQDTSGMLRTPKTR